MPITYDDACPATGPFERPLADHRHAALARRIAAGPELLAVIAELAWPPRDGMATGFRIAPNGAGNSAHG